MSCHTFILAFCAFFTFNAIAIQPGSDPEMTNSVLLPKFKIRLNWWFGCTKQNFGKKVQTSFGEQKITKIPFAKKLMHFQNSDNVFSPIFLLISVMVATLEKLTYFYFYAYPVSRLSPHIRTV
jgi:hypothetical protein